MIIIPHDNSPYNITPYPAFIWNFSEDDNTIFFDSNPEIEPDFIFDPIDNYETSYPRFTDLVKNLKVFVKQNPKVLSALQYWSGFSKQQIIDHLSFGQGPTIKLESTIPIHGTNFYGVYEKSSSTIKINLAYVQLLELINIERYKEGVAFLLAVTLLHEYVHFGTTHNNISEGGYDFGYGFENDVFNVIVENSNALDVVINFQPPTSNFQPISVTFANCPFSTRGA